MIFFKHDSFEQDAQNLSLRSQGLAHPADENLGHHTGSAFAAVMPIGQGKMVFLADNVHYRMFWREPSQIIQNAVMLLPAF
jgi:hypothetical protein